MNIEELNNIMNIEELYKKTFHIGYDIQIKTQEGNTIDGKGIWGEIEATVKDIKIEGLTYNKENLEKIYPEMKKIIEEYDMGGEKEFKIISNHFFMQLMNLVIMKSPPENSYTLYLNRVLQIAFNAGQLRVFIEKKTINDRIIDFVKKYKLLNLSTYVNSWTLNEINEALKKAKLQNGGYYEDSENYKYIDYLLKMNKN